MNEESGLLKSTLGEAVVNIVKMTKKDLKYYRNFLDKAITEK